MVLILVKVPVIRVSSIQSSSFCFLNGSWLKGLGWQDMSAEQLEITPYDKRAV